MVGLLGVAGAPVGWAVSDRFESDNEFCVACHLDSGRRLHDRKMRGFEADPAVTLASLHALEDVRCIDCHGGASFPNKLRVKAVAARDAVRYFLGTFEEPSAMAHPLWDEDCIQCHAAYESSRDDDFHAFEAHNVGGFAYSCVACHERYRDRR